MEEKKYKIKQVTCTDPFAHGEETPRYLKMYLRALGFEDREDRVKNPIYDMIHIGAVPKQGVEFFVFYREPENPKEDMHGGHFRMVKVAGGIEELVDDGCATGSHFHEGLKTLTFYGKGKNDWSFHCIPEEIKQEE